MAIAFRNSNSNGNTTGTSTTLNKPTGTVDNDVMVIGLYIENISDTINFPAGWSTPVSQTANDNSFRFLYAWKRASSEGTSYTITWTTSVFFCSIIMSYSGVTTSGDPNDVAATKVANTFENNLSSSPSITPSASDDMLICMTANFGITNALLWTQPSGMTKRASNGDMFSAELQLASNTATGTKTFTVTGGGETAGISLVLKTQSTNNATSAWFTA